MILNQIRQFSLAAFVISAVSLSFFGPAKALNWRVDMANSSLSFSLKVAGQTVEGRAEKFTPTIQFDPNNPAQTTVLVLIDMTSLTVGNPDGDAALKKKEWFDIPNHPDARFEASTAKALGEGGRNKYELQGTLTLKGLKKPQTLPFKLDLKANTAVAQAEIIMDRNDFDIGSNADTGPIKVGKDVVIKLKISATRQN